MQSTLEKMIARIICADRFLDRAIRKLINDKYELQWTLASRDKRFARQHFIDSLWNKYDSNRKSFFYPHASKVVRDQYDQEWHGIGHMLDEYREKIRGGEPVT